MKQATARRMLYSRIPSNNDSRRGENAKMTTMLMIFGKHRYPLVLSPVLQVCSFIMPERKMLSSVSGCSEMKMTMMQWKLDRL